MRFVKTSLATVCILSGSVVILSVFSLRAPIQAGGGANQSVGNGDTNCDGTFDLSDAVYLLEWLFRTGAPPCAIAQDSPGLEGLIEELRAIREAQWPPKASNIVNLMESGRTGAFEEVLYTVPKGKWLVVTHAHTGGARGGVRVLERSEDADTSIPTTESSWVPGWVVQPGTQLVAASSEVCDGCYWRVLGYLTSE